jgi:hypothetical protein
MGQVWQAHWLLVSQGACGRCALTQTISSATHQSRQQSRKVFRVRSYIKLRSGRDGQGTAWHGGPAICVAERSSRTLRACYPSHSVQSCNPAQSYPKFYQFTIFSGMKQQRNQWRCLWEVHFKDWQECASSSWSLHPSMRTHWHSPVLTM